MSSVKQKEKAGARLSALWICWQCHRSLIRLAQDVALPQRRADVWPDTLQSVLRLHGGDPLLLDQPARCDNSRPPTSGLAVHIHQPLLRLNELESQGNVLDGRGMEVHSWDPELLDACLLIPLHRPHVFIRTIHNASDPQVNQISNVPG